MYITFTAGGEEDEEVFFTKSTNEGSSFSKVISINNNDEDVIPWRYSSKREVMYTSFGG